MIIPRRLWRFSTGDDQIKLATRFGLPYDIGMQDWEYEVARFDRIDEFLAAYESDEISQDERFSLMEMTLEAFRGSGEIESNSPRWQHTYQLIEKNIDLHIYTVCYWACLQVEDDELDDDNAFEAAPAMRALLKRHKDRFGYPFPEDESEDSEIGSDS